MSRKISVLNKHRSEIDKINRAIEDVLGTNSSSKFLEYATLSDGKRIRPLLFLMVCRSLGYSSEEIYLQSTVYELIHAASLMHDDVLDNAELRRNRPTVNAVWGNQIAVLGGDNLYIAALKLALETKNLEYISLIINTVNEMTQGQILELQNMFNYNLDKPTYFKIIKKKTATLIAAALKGAGIICNAPQGLVEGLFEAGLNMGTAFQMIDDLLDITGKQEELGKEIGKDLKEGKITLPLIYLLELTGSHNRERLDRLLKSERIEYIVSHIREEILENGIARRILDEAKELSDRAEEVLEELPPCNEKDYLIELNRFIIARDF